METLADIYHRVCPNFTPDEFRCKCKFSECVKDAMKEPFLAAIQDLRNKLGFPLPINSGYRCKLWNERTGGKQFSQHINGIAADISTNHLDGEQRLRFVSVATKMFNGVGIYKGWIHVDLRNKPPRALWVG